MFVWYTEFLFKFRRFFSVVRKNMQWESGLLSCFSFFHLYSTHPIGIYVIYMCLWTLTKNISDKRQSIHTRVMEGIYTSFSNWRFRVFFFYGEWDKPRYLQNIDNTKYWDVWRWLRVFEVSRRKWKGQYLGNADIFISSSDCLLWRWRCGFLCGQSRRFSDTTHTI